MSKAIFVGVMISTLTATAALSADAVVEPAPPAPAPVVPVASYDWNGIYAGLHIGGAWGQTDFAFPPTSSTDVDGVFGGGQVGYNFQTGNWLLGAEADISASGIEGSASCPAAAINCNADVNWLATVRGRVGYAHENFLIYGTGGLSIADVDYDAIVAATGTPVGPTVNDTATGYNVGGGVEWGFMDNWSAKVEYLYHDFSGTSLSAATFTPGGATADLDFHTVKVGLNYRFNFLN